MNGQHPSLKEKYVQISSRRKCPFKDGGEEPAVVTRDLLSISQTLRPLGVESLNVLFKRQD